MVLTLCMVLVLVPATEFANDSVYDVPEVSQLCEKLWDSSTETSEDNIMESQEDGTYKKVYTIVAVMNNY